MKKTGEQNSTYFDPWRSKHLVKCVREKKAFVIKIKEKGKEKKEWRRSKERTNK